jgi:hypothetical protein
VIAGAEKSKAGCARRRTGKVPKDQGSIPCISTRRATAVDDL